MDIHIGSQYYQRNSIFEVDLTMQWPEIVLAGAGTVGGGGILGLLTYLLNRQKQKSEDSRLFRDELKEQANSLRAQIELLKAEVKQKESELEMWKERYWKIFIEHKMFQVSVRAILTSHNLDPDKILPETKNEE